MDVRELTPSIAAKRREAVVEIVDVPNIDRVEAATKSAEPRMEPVAGSARQPAKVAEAKSESEPNADSAESEE